MFIQVRTAAVSYNTLVAAAKEIHVHLGGSILPFFWNFMKSHGFAVPLGTVQYGELPIFIYFGSKTSESYPFTGQ